MRNVVIVEAVRTPVGRRKGAFKDVRPDELFSEVLKGVVERAGVPAKEVEDVIAGCVTQIEEQAPDIARQAALLADFPIEVPGVTLDRQCGSSQQAVHFGAQAIQSGDMDVVIAGGVESMTRVPMFSNMKEDTYSPVLKEKYEMINQGLSAERIAELNGFSRELLDNYALTSHTRAAAAQEAGAFTEEILPVEIEDTGGARTTVTEDEGVRPDTTFEALAELDPVFQADGNITAGNASQMSDGASAVLLMAEDKAEALGLKPLARIISRSVVGSDPTLMLTGPVPATEKALAKAGLSIEDIALAEVNEAFASVPLHWQKAFGFSAAQLNVNGGAIALGHPLGATGTKLLTTLTYELKRRNEKYGLLAICEGLGMANATIIENLT